MDQTQLIHEVLRMLRRRAVPIAFTGVIGVLLAAFAAFTLPPRYQTSARILVESQQIPDELARSTVTSSAGERLHLIEQRLMARDSIAALIDRLGLYADRPDMSLTKKIESVRASTQISIEQLGLQGGRSSSSIAITVTYGDPDKAAAIANELVSAMLQQNLETRSEQTRQTLHFFDEERDRLSAEITRLDGEITAFKTVNEAVLPDSLEFRRDEMGRLLESSLEIDRRVLALEEQRGALQSGLADDEVAARAISPEETLLRQLETDLAQKKLRLAESHPEIQDLRGRIAAIGAIVNQGAGAGRGGNPAARPGSRPGAAGSAAAPGTAPEDGAAGPADGAPTSARARAVQRQIDLLASQIGLLEEQRRGLSDRRAAIEASLQVTPKIETALAEMTRRRDGLLEQYGTIIAKRVEAETGERLEASQQAERFEVIENALPPEGPVAPSRKKILVFGAAASFAAALGLAFVIEMLNPAIRSSVAFQRQLEMAPLAAIPYVRTRRERMRRGVALALAAVFVVTAVPAGLWAIDRHIRPIQSIIDRAAERSGVDGVLQRLQARF